MDKESLMTLIKQTKEKINNFENYIFKERTSDYSIYRAETSIYLDTISFLEKVAAYELDADEIESIKVNLLDIQRILDEDMAKADMKHEEISEEKTATPDEFKTINFDSISEEVNTTSNDYASIDNFLNSAELPIA